MGVTLTVGTVVPLATCKTSTCAAHWPETEGALRLKRVVKQ